MKPKFKIGDLVRCLNPTHPGENPFVVKTRKVWIDGKECVYYPVDIGEEHHLNHHASGAYGCLESEIELVKERGDGEEH